MRQRLLEALVVAEPVEAICVVVSMLCRQLLERCD